VRCTSPRTVGFYQDGKTLCWSPKKYSKEYATFQIACGKCVSCRLESARQTAVRCVHEASLHEFNIFLTLTYSDEYIGDNRLRYSDIQKFQKDLRNELFQGLLDGMFPGLPQKEQRGLWKSLNKERRNELYGAIRVSFLVAGEYGGRTKRAHWHMLIFNYRPHDAKGSHTSDRGDLVETSEFLNDLWGKGKTEFGKVTFESAGYCARYAAKKLVHGKDKDHDYHPIARRSCRYAIGKGWIEKNWRDVFGLGYLVLWTGSKMIQCGIPRFYEKWLIANHPLEWEKYIKEVKTKVIDRAVEKESKISLEEKKANLLRYAYKGLHIKKNKVREKIVDSKFKKLQESQKL
jgi:hypothetical protein